MPLILGTNSIKDTGYDVANSCRFNDGDTAYMHKTFASGGTETAWTISMWVKRGALGSDQRVFSCDDSSDGDPDNYWRFKSDDTLQVNIYNGSTIGNLVTNRVFRDVSAWYHICVIWKSGDSTSTDRLQLWVNGTRETSFSATTFPSQDAATITSSQVVAIGRRNYGPQQYFDGYLAEVVFLDGVTASPVGTLGEFDEDSPRIFKPKDPSGLTFGTNGFYLDFEDSSNLGNDANGGTDFTEVNLAATDQATDTCTNNFCTLNPLDGGQQDTTLSEGNLKIDAGGSASWGYHAGTFHVSSGKWYWEMKVLVDNPLFFGVVESENTSFIHKANVYPYKNYGGFAIYSSSSVGQKQEGTTDGRSTYQSSQSVNDIMGIALDLDNNRLYTSKNGQWSDGSGNNDEASPNAFLDLSSNLSVTNPSGWRPIFSMDNNADVSVNFGNPAYANSSSVADANGYGSFEYAPPSGYYALCTKNLAEYGG